MKAYQYNSETKVYVGEIDRQIDPLESQAQGVEIYLMPANSTDVVPPEAKDGYDIVFNGTDWEYKEIPKEPEPTNEDIKLRRANLYAKLIDPLHAQKQRKTVLGEWTEVDEAEYVEQVKALTAKIQEENPYVETLDNKNTTL